MSFKESTWLLQEQQHIRGLHVAEIWLSKRGPEEARDRTVCGRGRCSRGSADMHGGQQLPLP